MSFRWLELSSTIFILNKSRSIFIFSSILLRYYISGPKKGSKEVFARLPGLSDAIRLTEHNTLLVPFVYVIPVSPSLTGYLGRFSIFRAILSFVDIFHTPHLLFNLLRYIILLFKILSPSEVMNLMPKYGLVAEYDMNAKLLKTWHDKTGQRVGQITSAVLHDNKLYLGSYSNDFIAIVNYK